MLIDTELDRLNRLVLDELSSGHSPLKGLGALTTELESAAISVGEIDFGTKSWEHPLPHQILLCGQSGLSLHMSKVYTEIAGSGVHYNGMFGHGKTLAECVRLPDVALAIETVNKKPAPIAEQVLLCARLLCTTQDSLMPQLAAAVRRHLSGIMLQFPVLLHPSILMARLSGPTQIVDYTSLASILATSPHGALPRYSHFRSRQDDKEAGQIDHGLIDRLSAFAKHPCVRRVFEQPATRLRQDPHAVTARGREIKISTEKLSSATMSALGPRVEFLASVMELDELAGTYAGELVRPFWSAVKNEPYRIVLLDSILTASIFAAAGGVHAGALHGIPDEMRAYRPDMGFLTAVRRRQQHLFDTGHDDSGIGQALLKSCQRRIFLGRQDALAPAEVRHNTRNLAMALHFIGFCNSQQEAAVYLLEVCAGFLRPDGNLPRVDTTGAVAFLKAVDTLGGLGSCDDEVVARIGKLRDTISDARRPFMDAWITAADALASERLMTSVIDRVASAATSPICTHPSEPMLGRRRSRASLYCSPRAYIGCPCYNE